MGPDTSEVSVFNFEDSRHGLIPTANINRIAKLTQERLKEVGDRGERYIKLAAIFQGTLEWFTPLYELPDGVDTGNTDWVLRDEIRELL